LEQDKWPKVEITELYRLKPEIQFLFPDAKEEEIKPDDKDEFPALGEEPKEKKQETKKPVESKDVKEEGVKEEEKVETGEKEAPKKDKKVAKPKEKAIDKYKYYTREEIYNALNKYIAEKKL